jgi:LemA protein
MVNYVIAVIGATALVLVYYYNSLVQLRNRIENAWSQIDVQLKKRYDLLPNLVETVKGYAKHEKSVFKEVTEARANMANAKTVKEQAKAQNMITDALKSLFAVSENYPKLEASKNFLMLQEELSGIESKIAYARQFYNDEVLKYDNMMETFPSNLVAKMFSFVPKEYFGIEEKSREPVKVQF